LNRTFLQRSGLLSCASAPPIAIVDSFSPNNFERHIIQLKDGDRVVALVQQGKIRIEKHAGFTVGEVLDRPRK
jgi:hypothetical protein